MIDIHSHIIFGVDDGPKNLDESLKMLYEAEKAGIRTIIATPHLKCSFVETGKVEENFNILSERSANFNIKLKKGFELYINFFIPDSIYKKRLISLNHSPLQLVEFPINDTAPYAAEIIYRMQINSLIPVIAHPERCITFKNNVKILYKYMELGCKTQINAASILGSYGSYEKHLVKKLLKNGRVDFVASDAHCADDYSKKFLKAYEKIIRLVGEDVANKIYKENAFDFFPIAHNTVILNIM